MSIKKYETQITMWQLRAQISSNNYLESQPLGSHKQFMLEDKLKSEHPFIEIQLILLCIDLHHTKRTLLNNFQT